MALLTEDELTRAGWTKRGDFPLIYRFDLPAGALHWLLVTQTLLGWHADYFKGGMRSPYGTLITTTDLETFTQRAKAGKL